MVSRMSFVCQQKAVVSAQTDGRDDASTTNGSRALLHLRRRHSPAGLRVFVVLAFVSHTHDVL